MLDRVLDGRRRMHGLKGIEFLSIIGVEVEKVHYFACRIDFSLVNCLAHVEHSGGIKNLSPLTCSQFTHF